MSKEGAVLAAKILAEFRDLSMLIDRAVQGWERAKRNDDDYYLDGVALNLHGFYSGLERIFQRIASAIDSSVPSGANWHQDLLNQISIEVPGVRPSVISTELKEKLEEYRGFRHVVRNVYTYHLNSEKMEKLVAGLPAIQQNLEIELKGFAKFLQIVE